MPIEDDIHRPAYEVLDLPEQRVIEIRHDEVVAGPVSAECLLAVIARQGRVDGILECAEGLPYGLYLEVLDAWKAAPAPARPKTRRRR